MYKKWQINVKKYIASLEAPTLLAVSGGIDSSVLAHIYASTKEDFAIAHAHFGLRGEDSNEDAAFVAKLAQRYGVPFFIKKFDTTAYAKKNKVSIQMAARELRYEWFQTLLVTYGFQQIATAHHHDDRIETFFRNVVKGTGIAGLRSILPASNQLIRPLLTIPKEALITYAKAHQLTWREDASNNACYYNRNFIRHEIIPLLQKLNPGMQTTFARTFAKLEQIEILIEEQSNKLKQVVWEKVGEQYHIHYALIANNRWTPTILLDWLAPFGFTFAQLQQWHDHPPQVGKKLYSATHWLLAERNRWILGIQEETDQRPILVDAFSSNIAFLNNMIAIREVDATTYTIVNDRNIAALDKEKLSFPLVLRPWKLGDTFCPLGMGGQHKKVSDFLIDTKVPRHEKNKTYVLTSAGEIVWVVGHRIDERYKLQTTTQKAYILTLIPYSV